ncbi:MAG: hypothetical protein IKZ82_04125 [Clostridia bacterium]|nr:hypothetical protein [Clostridia bacterium]
MEIPFATDWLRLPARKDGNETRLAYFRRQIILSKPPASCPILITADARYKLYVNGCFVQAGPQKAIDATAWYVDPAELAPFLRAGKNAVAVEVLYFGSDGHSSLLETRTPHLYIGDENGRLSGKSGWRCTAVDGVSFPKPQNTPSGTREDAAGEPRFSGWKTTMYDDSDWEDAVPYTLYEKLLKGGPFCLVPRTIPLIRTEEKRLTGVSALREGGQNAAAWNALLEKDAPLTIPAHTKCVVELSAGAEENGYLLYAFAGGKYANIETLCSEGYVYQMSGERAVFGVPIPTEPQKGDRTDAQNGVLLGETSTYTVFGFGTVDVPEEYEPFWFRTFRFLRLTVETADEPLTVLRLRYRATGYPLEVQTRFSVADEELNRIYEISERTLRRCMQETYFDCPFYEQLQYVMDTRSEALFTYCLSADDRLARQALEAFAASQRPDGLLNACAPSRAVSAIPGFSIYYIRMLHDHWLYFGDAALVRKHLGTVDRILDYFGSHLLESGLVGKVGGRLFRHRNWSFIDWADGWNSGTPDATDAGDGAITMESLLYLYGLQAATDLNNAVFRHDTAGEYRTRAAALQTAIRAHCMGSFEGVRLLQDGPGQERYSVHCQMFAVLTDTVTAAEGKAMLLHAVGNASVTQPSVSMQWYLFRALERCGLYESTDALWEPWRQMLRDNLTTCTESNTNPRSDCHAWSSLLCYELPSKLLGVTPASAGYETVRIEPHPGRLTEASGSVITPKGVVSVAWKKCGDGTLDLTYSLPEGMRLCSEP